MANLHVRHIKTQLEKYAGLVDLADKMGRGNTDRENVFLSRALALFALDNFVEVDPSRGADAVVDGFDDNGIDLVYFDQPNSRLYVIQSKFIQNGIGCPEQGDVKKFCDGIRDLIDAKYENFNARLQKHEAMIQSALDDTRTQIVAVLVYTGGPLSTHASKDMERLCEEVNDPTDYLEFLSCDLAEIHRWLVGLVQANDITFEIMLNEWGKTEKPLASFYGQVNCLELVTMYEKFTTRMLNQNIRKFLGDTSINEAIQQTATESPELFFFFNNGITIVCSAVEKTVKGGGDRISGTFRCTGAQIVNGAQTIGSLKRATEKHRDQVERAKVFVRLISLGATEPGLAVGLTRATNTQNKVEKKDFVTLDPTQERLRQDFFLENVQYIYKSGDQKAHQNAITIEEATSALACASGNLNYAILAKKEIGKLWERTDAAPYLDLFPIDVSAQKINRKLSICRAVDDALSLHRKARGDERNLAVHGNKIIQYLVFKTCPKSELENPSTDFDPMVRNKTAAIFDAMQAVRKARFPDALLGRLFYNQTKTQQFVDEVVAALNRSAMQASVTGAS